MIRTDLTCARTRASPAGLLHMIKPDQVVVCCNQDPQRGCAAVETTTFQRLERYRKYMICIDAAYRSSADMLDAKTLLQALT